MRNRIFIKLLPIVFLEAVVNARINYSYISCSYFCFAKLCWALFTEMLSQDVHIAQSREHGAENPLKPQVSALAYCQGAGKQHGHCFHICNFK